MKFEICQRKFGRAKKQSRTQSLRLFWQGREALDNADEIRDMTGLCCFLPQYPNVSSIVVRISNKQY